MNVLRRSLALAAVCFLSACAATQQGGESAAPIGEDQMKLHVVNDSDSPVDVFSLWDGRTGRIRLGSVSIGREADFGVPWVGGYLRVVFQSPLATQTITSNALVLAEANRNDELIVTVNWANRALLEIRK